MNVTASEKLNKIGGYAFDEVNKLVAKLKVDGINPIDFGVGDPTAPTPEFVRKAVEEALDVYESAGYPSYIGQLAHREEIAKWMKKRFGITLDPDKETCATIGSKEAVFHLP